MFTGRQLDEETGLYFYRARYYDPVKGRFLQRDPLGYVDGTNLYEYVKSNPSRFTDPTGQQADDDDLAGPCGKEDFTNAQCEKRKGVVRYSTRKVGGQKEIDKVEETRNQAIERITKLARKELETNNKDNKELMKACTKNCQGGGCVGGAAAKCRGRVSKVEEVRCDDLANAGNVLIVECRILACCSCECEC